MSFLFLTVEGDNVELWLHNCRSKITQNEALRSLVLHWPLTSAIRSPSSPLCSLCQFKNEHLDLYSIFFHQQVGFPLRLVYTTTISGKKTKVSFCLREGGRKPKEMKTIQKMGSRVEFISMDSQPYVYHRLNPSVKYRSLCKNPTSVRKNIWL